MVTFIMLSYDSNAIDAGVDVTLERYGKGLIKTSPDYPIMTIDEPLADSQEILKDIMAIFQNKQVHTLICDGDGNLLNSTLQ